MDVVIGKEHTHLKQTKMILLLGTDVLELQASLLMLYLPQQMSQNIDQWLSTFFLLTAHYPVY